MKQDQRSFKGITGRDGAVKPTPAIREAMIQIGRTAQGRVLAEWLQGNIESFCPNITDPSAWAAHEAYRRISSELKLLMREPDETTNPAKST